MTDFHGQCHCGNIEINFRSEIAPDQMEVRACQCAFCVKHAARAVTDPDGSIEVVVSDPSHLLLYRFGLGTADFVICGRCGVYVAAIMADEEQSYGTAILNTFDDPALFSRPPIPVDYSDETGPGRRDRRRERWTPAVLRFAD